MPILKQLVSNSAHSKRRSRADLTAEMISAPLGDFRHTMHQFGFLHGTGAEGAPPITRKTELRDPRWRPARPPQAARQRVLLRG
uniref:Uncharacterized protein n=1 Tax=Terrapene triunguis TaxID=2587831 RepID=A0A674K208_9SAUR